MLHRRTRKNHNKAEIRSLRSIRLRWMKTNKSTLSGQFKLSWVTVMTSPGLNSDRRDFDKDDTSLGHFSNDHINLIITTVGELT